MKATLAILFYASSVLAAVLWWYSAAINIPVVTWAGIEPHGEFMSALNRSAQLNGWAAFTTGLSVLFSAARERVR
jgi:hypothetical protein